MDRVSFGKACSSVEIASKKLEQMKAATDLKTLSQLWSEFLTEIQRFNTRMVIACKDSSASAWWGKIKNERISDELLQYVHQARHADEHGIADITETTPAGIAINPKEGKSLHVRHMMIGNGSIYLDSETAEKVMIEFIPSRLQLVAVSNRGVRYSPPQKHLGIDITDVNPISIASLTIEYISRIRDYAKSNYLQSNI